MHQSTKDPLTSVLDFVGSINTGDPDSICSFLTEDHLFIDSLGNEVRGRENMRKAWNEYFKLIGDYRIEVRETFVHDEVIILLGLASGSLGSNPGAERANKFWRVPAAWKAVVVGGKLAQWQVFADNSRVLEIFQSQAE